MKFSAFLLAVFIFNSGFAQNRQWSIGAAALYTTEADIYYNPNAADPALRNSATSLPDIISPSLQITWQLGHDLDLLFEAEWQRTTYTTLRTVLVNSEVNRMAVVDGYEVFPIELDLVYRLPFKPGNFTFFIGGGVGYYFGRHIRQAGQNLSETRERTLNYGIQTLLGTEYRIMNAVSATFGMKFRDAQIKMKNRYTQDTFLIKGETVSFGPRDFDSKVNLNGIVFFLGIKSYF